MAKDSTDITVLLDRSGSMNDIKTDVIGGFNQFVKQQQEIGDNAVFTLVQFDSQSIDTVQDAVPIKDAKLLTPDTFIPGAMTPLRDALGQTIIKTGARLSAIPEQDRPDKVVFCIYTDGLENHSREFTAIQIREMTAHQHDVYKWQFVYLGASQDAFAAAADIGIPAAAAANFSRAQGATAMKVASANVASYRKSSNAADLQYSQVQREMLEDDEHSKKGK